MSLAVRMLTETGYGKGFAFFYFDLLAFLILSAKDFCDVFTNTLFNPGII